MTDSFSHEPGSGEAPFEQGLSVAVLRGICADIVEEDTSFAEHQKRQCRPSHQWETWDDVTYDVSIAAWHSYPKDEQIYDEPTYLGQEYEVAMQISYELDPNEPPRELLEYLSSKDEELPDGMEFMTITYGIELYVHPDNTFGWQETRLYDVSYREETIDSFPSEATAYDLQSDVSETGIEVSQAKHMRVTLELSSHTPAEDSPELAETIESGELDNDTFQRLVAQLIDSCQADPNEKYLNLAVTITEMLKFRDEGDFDLATVFPADVMEAIQQDSEEE